VDDGLAYVQQQAKEDTQQQAFDLIIFDINANDLSLGLSFPPRPFLLPSLLRQVKSLLSNKQGSSLLVNFGCRNSSLRAEIFEDLRSVFKHVWEIPVDEDVNTILLCFPENAPSASSDKSDEKSTTTTTATSSSFDLAAFASLLPTPASSPNHPALSLAWPKELQRESLAPLWQNAKAVVREGEIAKVSDLAAFKPVEDNKDKESQEQDKKMSKAEKERARKARLKARKH